MPLSQGELDAVRRQAIIDAGRRAPRKVMAGGDGRMIRSVPFEAYQNAVRVHGESPKDEGYWADMDRRHPEIVVKSDTGKVMVSMATSRAGRSCHTAPVRTRLGNGTRYYYKG